MKGVKKVYIVHKMSCFAEIFNPSHSDDMEKDKLTMGIRNGSWESDSGLFSFSNLNSNMSSPEQKSALSIILDVIL